MRVFIPLVVFAQLDRQGGLSPNPKTPWIPRIWLAPNEGQNAPIGDYTALDEFLTVTPFEAADNWSDSRAYAEGMIVSIPTLIRDPQMRC